MMDATTMAALVAVALVAGFVDSIAGGGGLLCLPALLLAGLDPVAALATNKLQGTFGTGSATFTFWRKGLLDPRQHWPAIVTTLIGAALGVACISYAPKALLTTAMPILLIAVAAYFAFAPKMSETGGKTRLPLGAFAFGFAPMLGFYDGIFGPGTGSFFMLALTALFGLGIVEATGRTKLFNFVSNVASLLAFTLTGAIVWKLGLAMAVGQVIGAQAGSRLAIKNGAKIIRPLLVIVCVALAAKLLVT